MNSTGRQITQVKEVTVQFYTGRKGEFGAWRFERVFQRYENAQVSLINFR